MHSSIVQRINRRRDYPFWRWWMSVPGLRHRDVVGWYEPLGAPSKAHSQLDLSIYTGRWNATDHNNMAWNTSVGWTGGSPAYLSTSINPKSLGIVSAFARIDGTLASSDRMIFGMEVPAGNSKFYIKPYSGSTSPGIEFALGGSRNDGPTNYRSSGTLGMTSQKQYRDGVPQGGPLNAINQSYNIYLMAENLYNISPSGYFDGTLQLILFLNIILSDSQISALHTLAMSLPTGGAWSKQSHRHMLLETGDHLLLETGDNLEL